MFHLELLLVQHFVLKHMKVDIVHRTRQTLVTYNMSNRVNYRFIVNIQIFQGITIHSYWGTGMFFL